MRILRQMRWLTPLVPAAAVVLSALAAPAVRAADEGPPIALFNGKDFSGWYIFVNQAGKIDPQADPKKIFQIEDGVIHISGETTGYMMTNEEYENYHLTVEFKWGEKMWPPRNKPGSRRDSGILYHCVGPDKVWPKSIECQIQEHDCGDFFLVGGTSIVHDGQKYPGANVKDATKKVGGRIIKTSDAEKPTGEWNTVEVICDGGKCTHLVNGKVVNEGTMASVTKGKILLQSEWAEVYYRKVELRPLKAH